MDKTRTINQHYDNKPTMRRICICLLTALSVLAVEIKADTGSEINPDLKAVTEANTAFALELYGQLRTGEGNLFFSPFSVSTALAMTYGGAHGETQKQMAHTLHFNTSAGMTLHNDFATLLTDLNQEQLKGKVQLTAANSLWLQKGQVFQSDFLKLCNQDYSATITPVDFTGNPEAACKIINNWVYSKTQGKITDIIGPDTLVTSNQLVLVNAIYFKGKWDNQFKPEYTQVAPFHVSSKKTVTAPLMGQMKKFGLKDLPDLQVLELPYAGGDLSMIVLLPRKVEGLKDLEARLTPVNIKTWTQDLKPEKVNVTLPKFKIISTFSLDNALKVLGLSVAFEPEKADFSGMNGKTNLYISGVLHKAFVDVSEEGTEAAAATAVEMGVTAIAIMPEEFRVDHPFLFFIRENSTGSILFLGRIIDPTQG
jgi:serpin B